MLFREVPDAVLSVLRRARWLDQTFSVTMIRDLEGKVRLVIERTPPDQPSDTDRTQLESDLRTAIGSWLGDHEPVWRPAKRSANQALLDAIQIKRRPWRAGQVPFNLFRLERHAARHGWLGDLPYTPPWPLEDVDNGRRPPIITFFSHKGGVGRTTALVAVAADFAARGLRVLAIDLDLEAPGLGTLLSDPAPADPGLLDVLVGPLHQNDVLAVATPHANDIGIPGTPILVVKAGEVDEAYLELLARVDLQGMQDVNAFTQRVRDVIINLVDHHLIDVVLLDARTGFHDVGGVALGSLSHGAVFFAHGSEQSWHGLRAVARMLASAGYDSDDEPNVWLQVVHAMAPDHPAPERARFKSTAYDILSTQYYVSGAVPSEEEVEVLAIPYREALRGAGDKLTPAIVKSLQDDPWRDLAAAIAAYHPACLSARATP